MEQQSFSIRNEKNVTKQDILKEANDIWKKCKDIWAGIKPINKKHKGKKTTMITQKDYKLLDELYERVVSEHKQLAQAYPTVLRHMIQDMQYSPKVFAKYLDKLEKNPYTNDESRMDSYTDYFVMLMKECRSDKHFNATELSILRKDYRQRLQKEHDDFMEQTERYKKEVEEKQKIYDETKRKDLLSAFRTLSEDLKVPEEQIKQVEQMTESDMIRTEILEGYVYDLQRIKAGEKVEI